MAQMPGNSVVSTLAGTGAIGIGAHVYYSRRGRCDVCVTRARASTVTDMRRGRSRASVSGDVSDTQARARERQV
eukprot:1194155-Prorocentrum_minimum.AAC.6